VQLRISGNDGKGSDGTEEHGIVDIKMKEHIMVSSSDATQRGLLIFDLHIHK